MKKILFLVLIFITACSEKNTNSSDFSDSVKVDSVVIDTVKVDTVAKCQTDK
jgi:hypothetical protein